MTGESDEPTPRPQDEEDRLAEARDWVRAQLPELREAGRYLDEEYSLRGVRHRRAQRLAGLRHRRFERLETLEELRAGMAPGEARRQERRRLPGALRPGGYRRKFRAAEGFLWRHRSVTELAPGQTAGTLFSRPLARLGKAVAEELPTVDRDMTVLQAKVVVLLCWLLHDRNAHEIEPSICEFQELPWDPWSEVDGDQFQGRGALGDALDTLVPWLRDAMSLVRAAILPSAVRGSSEIDDPRRVRVDEEERMVLIQGFAAPKGYITAAIKGPSLALFFHIVRRLSTDREGLVPWEDVERAWAEAKGFGVLRTPGTLKDYARRIRRLLRESGLEHLWEMNPSAGVRWRGGG